MSTVKATNRWFVIVAAIIIQIVFGVVCAWSAFTNVLSDPDGAYQSTAPHSAWILSAGLFLFAQVLIWAGICSHFLW
ncbi:hypothetical protein [uncultured Desulfobacter sp.]|uniref:hypothetical protein n=1 Tax=uncultured Desulfobacter sp. TaxID=240139 RepID=UPI0029F4A3D3|nr:hypothetical protein [uncultured Desulfobacter sp.]